MAEHYQWKGADLVLRLRISPRASRDKVGELMGDRLKVSITAPPVDGKANAHLCALIAKQFGVAKSGVTVVAGETSRDKTVQISEPKKLADAFLVRLPS